MWMQGEAHVDTQGEDGHVQAEERDLRRNNPADALISDFWLPELQAKNLCCLSHPVCGTWLGQPQQTNARA